MCYFAQFALDCPGLAMVTASHNENGWTGVKMGASPPLTFGPDEMTRLKTIVLGGEGKARPRRLLSRGRRHARALSRRSGDKGHKLSRPIKVVAACGNGTAGPFAPEALRRIGAEVIPLDAVLDYTFPNYNPNPEDMTCCTRWPRRCEASGAEIALGFDGDGDRCGVVDDKGEEIFADKVGVLLARDLSARVKNAKFVVDVKSTGIYEIDPVLKANGATTDYWKTGHSYMKRRTNEIGAVAGFEKSGHYFFRAPIGRGYDDGIVAAIAVLEMLDRAGGKKIEPARRRTAEDLGLADHGAVLPRREEIRRRRRDDQGIRSALKANGEKILGQTIVKIVTVNGVRVTLEDGTWGLVRASSNKPSLVVVVESPVSDAKMHAMFKDLDSRLSKHPEVGEYDQKI